MQQHLPFTVLKPAGNTWALNDYYLIVATAPTVYGIETVSNNPWSFLSYVRVATAPTVYGIETLCLHRYCLFYLHVATAPTVYGIETMLSNHLHDHKLRELQQHLPFTVLKRTAPATIRHASTTVATAPTVYGIETVATNHHYY